MVLIGVADLIRQEMSDRVSFLEEGAWIDSDVFTRYQLWVDSPNFVVEMTAKLVEILDNTLQYALPQLS